MELTENTLTGDNTPTLEYITKRRNEMQKYIMPYGMKNPIEGIKKNFFRADEIEIGINGSRDSVKLSELPEVQDFLDTRPSDDVAWCHDCDGWTPMQEFITVQSWGEVTGVQCSACDFIHSSKSSASDFHRRRYAAQSGAHRTRQARQDRATKKEIERGEAWTK